MTTTTVTETRDDYRAVVEIDGDRATERVYLNDVLIYREWFYARLLGEAGLREDGLRCYARAMLGTIIRRHEMSLLEPVEA